MISIKTKAVLKLYLALALPLLIFEGTYAAPLCATVLLDSASPEGLESQFQKLNRNAQAPFAEYKNPNSRSLQDYDDITGVSSKKNINSLVALVPKKGVVIDLGGGIGAALHEMAKIKDINAIVINAQKPENFIPTGKTKGQFEYVSGWAEIEIKKYKGKADLVLDIWGAFSYSIMKAELIEQAYAALKPGGRAFILFHPRKTRALVKWQAQTQTGFESREARLDLFLEAVYPKIFKTSWSKAQETSQARIIEIRKPSSGGPESLNLGLTLKSVQEEVLPMNTFNHIELEWNHIADERNGEYYAL